MYQDARILNRCYYACDSTVDLVKQLDTHLAEKTNEAEQNLKRVRVVINIRRVPHKPPAVGKGRPSSRGSRSSRSSRIKTAQGKVPTTALERQAAFCFLPMH